jgi:hypothetical protein
VSLSNTAQDSKFFKTLFPTGEVYTTGYDEEAVERFVRELNELKEKEELPQSICVVDVNDTLLNQTSFRNLLMNNRQYKLCVFNTAISLTCVSESLRDEYDYIFFLHEPDITTRRQIYDEFFTERFSRFIDFNDYFVNATRDYGCLVLDTTCMITFNDMVCYYRADKLLMPVEGGAPVCKLG